MKRKKQYKIYFNIANAKKEVESLLIGTGKGKTTTDAFYNFVNSIENTDKEFYNRIISYKFPLKQDLIFERIYEAAEIESFAENRKRIIENKRYYGIREKYEDKEGKTFALLVEKLIATTEKEATELYLAKLETTRAKAIEAFLTVEEASCAGFIEDQTIDIKKNKELLNITE